MPQVPIYQPNLNYETSVPGTDIRPGSLGAEGAGIAALGNAIENIGLNLTEQKRKQQEQSYIEDEETSTILDIVKKRKELDNQQIGGYMPKRDALGNFELDEEGRPKPDYDRSMLDEFKDYADKRYRQSQDKAPTETARLGYVARANKFLINETLQTEASTMQKQTIYAADREKRRADLQAQNQFLTPNLELLKEQYNQQKQDIIFKSDPNGLRIFDHDTTSKLLPETVKQPVLGHLFGLEKIIQDTNQDPQVIQAARDQYFNTIMGAVPVQEWNNISKENQQTINLQEAVDTIGDYPPPVQKMIRDKAASVVNKDFTQSDITIPLVYMEPDKKLEDTKQLFEYFSPEEMRALIMRAFEHKRTKREDSTDYRMRKESFERVSRDNKTEPDEKQRQSLIREAFNRHSMRLMSDTELLNDVLGFNRAAMTHKLQRDIPNWPSKMFEKKNLDRVLQDLDTRIFNETKKSVAEAIPDRKDLLNLSQFELGSAQESQTRLQQMVDDFKSEVKKGGINAFLPYTMPQKRADGTTIFPRFFHGLKDLGAVGAAARPLAPGESAPDMTDQWNWRARNIISPIGPNGRGWAVSPFGNEVTNYYNKLKSAGAKNREGLIDWLKQSAKYDSQNPYADSWYKKFVSEIKSRYHKNLSDPNSFEEAMLNPNSRLGAENLDSIFNPETKEIYERLPKDIRKSAMEKFNELSMEYNRAMSLTTAGSEWSRLKSRQDKQAEATMNKYMAENPMASPEEIAAMAISKQFSGYSEPIKDTGNIPFTIPTSAKISPTETVDLTGKNLEEVKARLQGQVNLNTLRQYNIAVPESWMATFNANKGNLGLANLTPSQTKDRFYTDLTREHVGFVPNPNDPSKLRMAYYDKKLASKAYLLTNTDGQYIEFSIPHIVKYPNSPEANLKQTKHKGYQGGELPELTPAAEKYFEKQPPGGRTIQSVPQLNRPQSKIDMQDIETQTAAMNVGVDRTKVAETTIAGLSGLGKYSAQVLQSYIASNSVDDSKVVVLSEKFSKKRAEQEKQELDDYMKMYPPPPADASPDEHLNWQDNLEYFISLQDARHPNFQRKPSNKKPGENKQ